MAEWIEAGAAAPDFTLATHDGTKLKLSSLRGKTVVLYFYPKDDTPGCTKEACGFRDTITELEAADAVVLGDDYVTVDDSFDRVRGHVVDSTGRIGRPVAVTVYVYPSCD